MPTTIPFRPIHWLAILVLTTAAPAQSFEDVAADKAVVTAAASPYLGVSVAPLDAQTRAMFKDIDASVTQGVVLAQVHANTAAAKAGFRAGDVLTHFGDVELKTADDLVKAIQKHKAGAMVAYALRRGDGSMVGRLRLGARLVARPDRPDVPRPDGARKKDMERKREMERAHVRRREEEARRKSMHERANKTHSRVDKLEREIAELRRRAMARRNQLNKGTARRIQVRAPKTLAGWAERERHALKQAQVQRNKKRMAYHEHRLSILEEMMAAHTTMPGDANARVERKLDEILNRLDK